jgi:cytochrome c-type protein NapB
MRGSSRACVVVAGLVGLAAACRASAPPPVARSIVERAAGRAYDGAPPVVPHGPAGECTTCHDDDGSEIAGVGVAPASPHGRERMAGDMRRCRQCHVASVTAASFVSSRFNGLPQGPWRGGRFYDGAPPTIPHALQLRENCLACHGGPAARAEIRTSHPERVRCRQCHVPEGAGQPVATAARIK